MDFTHKDIRNLRKAFNYTQEQMAALLQIPRGTLNTFERGDYPLNEAAKKGLAEKFNMGVVRGRILPLNQPQVR